MLKHKNSTFRKYFIIEQFDRKMNLLRAKTIKIPDAELQKIIVLKDKVVFFTKVYQKGYLFSLTMQQLDTALNHNAPTVLVKDCNLTNEYSDFRIDYNADKNKLVIWYLQEENHETTINFQLIDNLVAGAKQEVHFPYKLSELSINKTVISADGNFLNLITLSKNYKSNKAADYTQSLVYINMQSGKVIERSINKKDTFLSTMDMIIQPQSNLLHITGFYGIKDDEDNKGYFDLSFNLTDISPVTRSYYEMDRKFVAGIIGLKYEQKGENLNKFKIRKTIPKTDGGVLLIAERSFITTQSDVFYVNGIPQTSSAKIFNNDELILLSLDSSGKLLWNEVLFKNQSSVNDGGYYNGVVIMINDDNVSLIYNDRLSANADVIQVSYKEDGSHHKKILMNSDQYYALVIPAEYNQVSGNSIVLPINQNRDFTYIKLIY